MEPQVTFTVLNQLRSLSSRTLSSPQLLHSLLLVLITFFFFIFFVSLLLTGFFLFIFQTDLFGNFSVKLSFFFFTFYIYFSSSPAGDSSEFTWLDRFVFFLVCCFLFICENFNSFLLAGLVVMLFTYSLVILYSHYFYSVL